MREAGIIIGKGGTEIEKLRKEIEAFAGKPASVNVIEIKQPDLNAQLVAENISAQLEKRIAFRRAMKQAIGRAIKLNAKGIKIMVSGRLGGAEIAQKRALPRGHYPAPDPQSRYRLRLLRGEYDLRQDRRQGLDL